MIADQDVTLVLPVYTEVNGKRYDIGTIEIPVRIVAGGCKVEIDPEKALLVAAARQPATEAEGCPVEGCKQVGDHMEMLAVLDADPPLCTVTAHIGAPRRAVWRVVLVSASGNRSWLACQAHRAAAVESAHALMPRRS